MDANRAGIDTSELKKNASKDELKEAYQTVNKGDNYKIGAGARIIDKPENMTFFLEVVLSLCEKEHELDLKELRSKLEVLESFDSLGYKLKCENDKTVICEKNILESEIKREYENLERIFSNLR
ncbi:MAG: hypothetical protein ACLFSM_06625 [Thermoplasmata archaeon]